MSTNESVDSSSHILIKFLDMLPIDKRKQMALVLSQIKKDLCSTISNDKCFVGYTEMFRNIRDLMVRIPLSLRGKLKLVLIDGLELSIDKSSVTTSIFVICLCALELSAFRNCDRSDLESEDIWITITNLNARIFPRLSEKVEKQRTNLPSLLSWSLCMLIYTFRSCTEWIYHQDCKPTSDFVFNQSLNFQENALNHPSIPIFMSVVLRAQSKQRPYPLPKAPYTLVDLLFASSLSNNSEILKAIKPAAKYDINKCILESEEPPLHPTKIAKLSENSVHVIFKEKPDHLPSNFKDILRTDSSEAVLSNLQLLSNLLLEKSDKNKELLDSLVFTLHQTPFILFRIRRSLTKSSQPKPKQAVKIYERTYCMLLQLWVRAAEHHILLKNFPQSYIWLVAFTCPSYEFMTNDGFVKTVQWTSRFLTVYQTLFRSTITSSPHWYLQIITDIVIAIIDRSEKDLTSEKLNEAMCICILSVSRPLSALRIEEPNMYNELSRAIKVPLECILARLAGCKVKALMDGKTTYKPEESTSTPSISYRLRELLSTHMLIPMIKACDKWALGQTRVGVRPAAAKVLLQQILSNLELTDNNTEGVKISNKLDLVKVPPAVGGLHVTEKLAIKRRH